MGNTNAWEAEKLARGVMKIFFLVDTSGSMGGAKIASVNTTFPESLIEVAEISRKNPDSRIKIAVLTFANDAQWMYDKPVYAEDFQWQNVNAAGLTAFGDACQKFEAVLSRSQGWMAEPNGSLAPVIIILSDGQPTDMWEKQLEKLKANKWFKVAIKIAIAIGNDADKEMLAKFTGSMETVITVHDVNQLSKMIKAVAVTSSMVNSKSSDVSAIGTSGGVIPSTSAPDPGKNVVSIVKNDVDSDPTLAGVEIGNTTGSAIDDKWDFE